MTKTKPPNSVRGEGTLPPGETRVTQRVLAEVKDRFLKERKRPTPINRRFGAGDQLNAAMFSWDEGWPDELKLLWLEWSLGLRPYDPKFGERIRAALSQVGLHPSPDRVD